MNCIQDILAGHKRRYRENANMVFSIATKTIYVRECLTTEIAHVPMNAIMDHTVPQRGSAIPLKMSILVV